VNVINPNRFVSGFIKSDTNDAIKAPAKTPIPSILGTATAWNFCITSYYGLLTNDHVDDHSKSPRA
jgi:hypothetical protein